jgi:hypothetical protein
VFAVNSMYYHNLILRRYCGVSTQAHICGEIQHSLWDEHFREHRESRIFPRLFTWNSLLNFSNQVTIGDPYLYANAMRENSSKELTQLSQSVLVMPKYYRSKSVGERVESYRAIIEISNYEFAFEHKLLLIHTEDQDLNHWSLIPREFESKWTFLNLRKLAGSSFVDLYIDYLTLSKNLITDYVGVHVLRRLLISGRDSVVVDKRDKQLDPRTSPGLVSELMGYIKNEGTTRDDKLQISRILLGQDFLKSPIELKSTLGLGSVRAPITRALFPLYKRIVNSSISSQWEKE